MGRYAPLRDPPTLFTTFAKKEWSVNKTTLDIGYKVL